MLAEGGRPSAWKIADRPIDADRAHARHVPRHRHGHGLHRPGHLRLDRGIGAMRRVRHAGHGRRHLPVGRHLRRRRRLVEVGRRRPLLHVRAPEHRPGHAGDGQEQDHHAGEDAGHRVQVPPEDAPRRRAADADHAASAPAARPPEEDAGADQDDRPAGRDLDQAAGPEAELLQAVDLADQLHDPAERGRADEMAIVGVGEGGQRLAGRHRAPAVARTGPAAPAA